MPYKIFTIPALSPQDGEEELNAFLRCHRVLQVQQGFVQTQSPCWSFLVEYSDSDARAAASVGQLSRRKDRVDYKTVLSAEEFNRFLLLKERRAEVSRRYSVPVYLVFTNDELASLARLPQLTAETINKVEGIAPSRLNHYIKEFIEPSNENDETSGPVDAADCGA